jgi:hypothetical protein
MKLEIQTKSWKLILPDNAKQKVIAGTYVVKCGKEIVAKESFNDGYGALDIAIPASIVAKAEELDKEICKTIVDYFEK